MSASSPAPASPKWATTCCASTSMRRKIEQLEARRHSDPRARASQEIVQRNVAGRPPAVHHRRRRGGRARHAPVHRRRHAARRGRLGRPAVRARAARNIGRHMTDYKVVVDKSHGAGRHRPTRCAPSSPSELRDARRRRATFAVVSNPEFLKEGAAVEDFMRPDRIVIGADDERGRSLLMRALYAPFHAQPRSDCWSWTCARPSSPSTRPTRCSPPASRFMNELANLAEQVGADIEMVRQGIGSDPRIGYALPLCRRGLRRLVLPEGRQGAAPGRPTEHGIDAAGAGAPSRRSTSAQKRVLVDEDRARASATDSHGRTFAVWGLAFKPNTDDMREAPSRVDHRRAVRARRDASAPTTRSRRRRSASACCGARALAR